MNPTLTIITFTERLFMKNSLSQNLGFLSLPYLRDEIDSLMADAVKKQMPLAEFFNIVIEAEVFQKQQRAIDRRISRAKFPQKKAIETFDWSHPKKINIELVRYLFTLNFLEGEHKKNVAFLGLPGLGKTHLMTALGIQACRHGYSVIFETAANVINMLHAAQASGDIIKALKIYTRPDILCLDEIGFLPIDQTGANLLFQVFSARYERGATMLTSNKAFKDWGEIFNDSAIASAILDRILHHCEVVTIEGKSYRMNPKKTITTV